MYQGETKDFYDKIDGSVTSFMSLLGFLLFGAFFISVWWWCDNKFILLLSCGVVPIAVLSFPRMARMVFLAYRGAPALRVGEHGVWSRQWSSLGWIAWRDIKSAECIRGGGGYEIVLHVSGEELARLSGYDQVSVMLVRLTGFLFFIDRGPNTLSLMDSSSIRSCSWDDFMETLVPILAAKGVPLLQTAQSA